jgi:hypothetical protein
MLIKKRPGHLSAGDAIAKQVLDRVGIGECVMCSIRRVRNPKLHRKFFALIKLAFDNWRPLGATPDTKNIEQFRKELIIAAGYYDVVLSLSGEPHLEAKSIAWDRMGEEEFTPLYEAVVEVLSRGFLPGLTTEQAERFALEVAEGF